MTHVFISYARRDGQTHAYRLDTALQVAGRATWFDRRGIDPARDFTAEIETAIRAASHVVACITPDTERADSFVRREIQYALMLDKPILVARVEKAAIPPIHIVNNTFIEFYKDWDGGVRQLLEYLDRPAGPATTLPIDHPLRGYVQRLYESANKHLETAIIRLIDLDIDDSPEAVPARPQPLDDIGLLFGDAKTETTFTTFAEAFTHFNRRALLLGEPGGGKTVTLMATARQAAADWLNDPDRQPLPILALISTWDSIKQPSLIDWLGSKKDLSPEPVREVMATGRALLLLDGLDELGAERTEKKADGIEERYDPRQRFITALNAGLGQNAALVTCREEEYQAIGQQASLEGAVTLRQLTDDQIRAYLSADPGLAPLQAAIDADDGLRQMSRTPLLLSYLAFGFRDRPEALRDLKDLSEGDLRDAVFMSYMDKRYDREVKRLAKMGQEPPFTLEFIKEVLGRVAMENAGGRRRRNGHSIFDQHLDNIIEKRDFVEALPEDTINEFASLCLELNYLRKQNDSLAFVHLHLRDSLAYIFSITNLDLWYLYDTAVSWYPNPASSLGAIRDQRAFTPLLRLMLYNSSDSHIIQESALALVDLKVPRVVDSFIYALSHHDRIRRRTAAYCLGKLSAVQALEPLVHTLADPIPEVRSSAADALGKLGDRRAVEPLISVLADPIAEVRSNAAGALGELGDHRAIEPLIQSLADPNDIVRSSSAMSLGQLGDKSAIGPLIQLLGDSVRANAASGLAAIGKTVFYPLLRTLRDESTRAEVREGVAIAFGMLGTQQAIDPLIQLLSDSSSDVRTEAAFALGQLGNTTAVDALISSLADNYESVRQQAAYSLGLLGDKRAVDALISRLNNSTEVGVSADVRSTIISALGKLADPRAVNVLVSELAGQGRRFKHEAAAFALEQIGTPEALAAVTEWRARGGDKA